MTKRGFRSKGLSFEEAEKIARKRQKVDEQQKDLEKFTEKKCY